MFRALHRQGGARGLEDPGGRGLWRGIVARSRRLRPRGEGTVAGAGRAKGTPVVSDGIATLSPYKTGEIIQKRQFANDLCNDHRQVWQCSVESGKCMQLDSSLAKSIFLGPPETVGL